MKGATMARMNVKTPARVAGDRNAGIAAERLRIGEILNSDVARRNPDMARKLALDTALDAESAKSILASAPAANPFLAAMEHFGPVGVDASGVQVSSDPKAERLAEIKGSMDAFNADRQTNRPAA